MAMGKRKRQPDLDRYLFDHRLVPDRALSLDPDQFKLRRTPSILLVDSARQVIAVWHGRLSQEKQAWVLAALKE